MGMKTEVKLRTDTVLLALAVLILAAIFTPFMTIWSLNTLFPQLAIPMNFYTWLAMVWINLMIIGRMDRKRA
jgi:hypothetical protein